jgi:SNF2 family DNA or RNA helicase
MPFLKTTCPTCKKVFESSREFLLSGVTVQVGKCGHFLKSEQLVKKDASAIVSLKGKKLFPFQAETVDFLEKNNARALVSHEMGLGKTVCALGFLALHPEALPVLAVVKKSLTTQWQHMTMEWIGEDEFAQVISTSKDTFIPGCKYYIISYDMVPRIKDLKEQVEKRGIKTLILDECQQIKNPEANRTIAIREISKLKTIEHVIALSGTPIKNNAQEYFPVLNILHPEIFPKYAEFVRWWCDSYWDGRKYKTGGLARPEVFRAKTESFIMRREYMQVRDQLPTSADPIVRNFSFHELGKDVEAKYKEAMKQFMDEEQSDGPAFAKEANILKYLSIMRHLAGLSLIDPCIDHVMEFLGSNDRKLIIFTHHNDVAAVLCARLASLMQELELAAPIRFQAGDNGPAFVEKFKTGPRVAIISTLAGGEGMDGMQHFCHDLIMLERQWNPSNEEQAEKRISQRIGQTHNVTATYFIAVGTVVEFFSEIVERKRQIVTETLGGRAVAWDQSSLMKELSETLATSGARRWGL